LRHLLKTDPTFLYQLRWEGGAFAGEWVSDNVPEALGYAAEELLAPGWWDANIHPDDAPRAVANHARLFAEGRVTQEYRIRAKDGRYLWIRDHATLLRDAAGAPTGAVGAWFDISDRKRTEQELAAARERYELATRAGRVGVWSHDLVTGRFDADPFLTELWGGPLDGAADDGRAWLRRVHPDDLERLSAANRAHLEGLAPEFRCEYRFFDAYGTERWALSCGQAARGADGRILRVAGTTTDITERKRAELALRETSDRLQKLSRRLLAVQEQERRRLARELHDEIGQLLTGLSFRLDAAAKATPAEIPERLAEARALVRELTAQVRELSQGLRPSLLDDLGLGPALDWLVSRFCAQTGLCGEVNAGRLGRYPPEVETAAYRIVQEALTNAARHASADTVEVRLSGDAAGLAVDIVDNGCGFDPASSPSGTGGLSGMRERAELLGGTLAIESAPGAGTRVTARLPGDRTPPPPRETDLWP
jgi:PAS domain S-box-containing protein